MDSYTSMVKKLPAICNQITGFLPLYKNIVNYTKSMFCIIKGKGEAFK